MTFEYIVGGAASGLGLLYLLYVLLWPEKF